MSDEEGNLIYNKFHKSKEQGKIPKLRKNQISFPSGVISFYCGEIPPAIR
jgi:hypothetical protein